MRAKNLLFIAAGIVTLWGIGHLVPTANIVKGFGTISPDNVRIITMEWIAEGVTLVFLGVLVGLVTIVDDLESQLAKLVYTSVAVMLLVMASVTLFTGAQTAIIPIKICPVIKSLSAVLILFGVYGGLPSKNDLS